MGQAQQMLSKESSAIQCQSEEHMIPCHLSPQISVLHIGICRETCSGGGDFLTTEGEVQPLL